MTKVAFIAEEDIFVANGTTMRLQRVLQLLHKRYDITVISCSKGHVEKAANTESIHLTNISRYGRRILNSRLVPGIIKLFPIVLWNMKLVSILLKNKFDLVYCTNDWLSFLSIYLGSKLRKYKKIFEAHSICSEESKELGYSSLRVRLDRGIERFAIMHSDFVIALSKNTFEFYQSYNRNIGLVPVFVDTDIFRTNNRGRRTGSKFVGIIGPFSYEPRQRYYLDFLYRNIELFDSRISFVAIGRCEHRIRNERIKYTGYLDSIQDYVTQLCQLDAVLVAEGIATSGPLDKIIEPMSCSVPVFTTPKGMIGLYWVKPGQDVLVFEENVLVDKINELVFDDELMGEIGRNARTVVEKYYSKKANEEKLIRILESVGESHH